MPALFLFHHHLGTLTLSVKSKLGHGHVHMSANGKEKRQEKKNPKQEIFFYASKAYLAFIISVHILLASIYVVT